MPLPRFLLALALPFAILAGGCASTAGRAQPSAIAGKSIAVASVAGREVRLLWVGTTVLNNEEKVLPVPDRGIDREIENTVVEVLRSTNRYSRAFAVSVDSSSPLQNLASVGADYLLLVEPGAGSDTRFHTNQYFRGIGLLQRSMFNSKPAAFGHVAVRLSLVEVATGKVVASAQEVNSWPSEILLSPGASLSSEDAAALEKKLLYRASGVVASAMEPLGVR